MTVGLRGLGYTDTGAGITPTNFESQCCGGWFGLTFAPDVCHGWAYANKPWFGDHSPCSTEGIANITGPRPAGPTPLPVPQIDLTAPSVEDPDLTISDIAAASAKADADQYARFIRERAAINNALGADRCGAFTKWNVDKQECEFSLTTAGGTTGLMLGVVAILLLLSYLKR